MRRFRSRVVTAIVVGILMLGLLGGVANARELPTVSFPEDPWGIPASLFHEDPWAIPTILFPEDPWRGLGN